MILLLMILTLVIVLFIKAFRNEKSLASSVIGIIIALLLNFKPSKPGDVIVCRDLKSLRKVIIPCNDRFLHTLVLGPTGSGKTSQILLPMIEQDLKNPNCGITVIEPKGDFSEKVYALSQYYGRDCLYFNPENETCPCFNPLHGEEDSVIETLIFCFRMIMSDSPDFFKDTVEELIRAAVKLLKRTKGNKANLLHLEMLVNDIGGIGQQLIADFQVRNRNEKDLTKKHENEGIIHYFKNDYFNSKSDTYKNTSSFRTQLARLNGNKFLRRVLNPLDGHNDIDFAKHLENNSVIAITTAQGLLNQTLSKLLGYLLILNFQSAVFRRSGDETSRKSHFLYIDEFQVYSNPSFSNMLTQGRSYRVASILATQNRQLITGNGSRDGEVFLDLVMANCRNLILFPDLPPEDSQYFSNKFGTRKTIRNSTSKSRGNGNFGYTSFSSSESENIEPIIQPTDISMRKFGEITYKTVQNKTAQKAGHGKVNFISSDINQKVDKISSENRELLKNGINPSDFRTTNGNLTKPLQDIIQDKNEYDNLL